MNSQTQQHTASSATIRVARMEKDERRMILLLTPEERKAALLAAARALLAQFETRNMA